jgi:hypothetical protein
LAILSIEHNSASKLNYSSVIDKFSTAKWRKMYLNYICTYKSSKLLWSYNDVLFHSKNLQFSPQVKGPHVWLSSRASLSPEPLLQCSVMI